MSTRHIPYGSEFEIDYHREIQERRVQRALKMIDPGDVIAIVESRLADESDPTQHPLYPMVMFFLDRQIAVDGGRLWDQWKQRVLAAISTATDDVLEMED